jgi:hypothetical protein
MLLEVFSCFICVVGFIGTDVECLLSLSLSLRIVSLDIVNVGKRSQIASLNEKYLILRSLRFCVLTAAAAFFVFKDLKSLLHPGDSLI